MKINSIDAVALILTIIGGLNWGLVSFRFNLVDALFGSMPWLVSLVYLLVGVSALWCAAIFTKLEKR